MKARKEKLPVCWAPWFTHRTLPTAWPSGTTWPGPTWAPWRSNCATKNQMSTTRCCGAWAGTRQTTGRKDVFFCTSLWNTTRWAWLFLPEPPWPRQAGRVLYTAVKGVLRDLCGQYYTADEVCLLWLIIMKYFRVSQTTVMQTLSYQTPNKHFINHLSSVTKLPLCHSSADVKVMTVHNLNFPVKFIKAGNTDFQATIKAQVWHHGKWRCVLTTN